MTIITMKGRFLFVDYYDVGTKLLLLCCGQPQNFDACGIYFSIITENFIVFPILVIMFSTKISNLYLS